MNIDTDITGRCTTGGGQAKESVCCGSTGSSYAVGGGQTQESTCCVPTTGGGCAQTIRAGGTSTKHNLNEWVASYQIYALKPAATNLVDSPLLQEPLLHLSDAYPSV